MPQWLGRAVAGVLCATAVAAMADQQATFRSGVELVTVDATIVDRDGPRAVSELAAAASAARVHVHAFQLPPADGGGPIDTSSPLASIPDSPFGGELPSAAEAVAASTGGIVGAFVSPNAAFERLSRELSGAYVIGFEPLPGDRDGRAHEIAVRIEGRRGLSIRARREFKIPAGSAPAARQAREPGTQVAPPAQPPATPRAERAARDATPPPATEALTVPLSTVLARVDAYVERFEREYSSFVAEERYVQLVKPWRGTPSSPDREPLLDWDAPPGRKPAGGSFIIKSRRLRSDVLLVQLPGGEWAGYRDVFEVEGREVRKRDDRAKQLFLSPAADALAQLRRISFESARYNLGPLRREVNLPTIPLIWMHPKYRGRMRFSEKGLESIGGRRQLHLEYREVAHPSIVGDSRGQDIPGWATCGWTPTPAASGGSSCAWTGQRWRGARST